MNLNMASTTLIDSGIFCQRGRGHDCGIAQILFQEIPCTSRIREVKSRKVTV